MDYELGFVKITDDKYHVVESSLDASEISLEVDECYAIFIKESEYDSTDIDMGFDYIGNIISERGESYYVFAFEDYQGYAFELSSLSDENEV